MIKAQTDFKKIERVYTIPEKELKDKLGIEGDVLFFDLEKGLTPTDDAAGKSHDGVLWTVKTRQEFPMPQKSSGVF